jgi:hypothetical protein
MCGTAVPISHFSFSLILSTHAAAVIVPVLLVVQIVWAQLLPFYFYFWLASLLLLSASSMMRGLDSMERSLHFPLYYYY